MRHGPARVGLTASTRRSAPVPTAKSTTKPPRGAKAELAASDPVLDQIEADLDALERGAAAWAHVTLEQRARLMKALHTTVSAVAEEWADTASTSKGVEPGHPLRGEEWLSGPYAVLVAVDAYRATLEKLAAGLSPLDGARTDAAPGGRVRAHVFPLSPVDGLLLSGFTGEVWFEPGVTDDEARRTAGLAQLQPTTSGGIGLVLGAGNVTSIPVLDVLYELLAHNRVAILKINPTQDALLSVFQRALAPLIEPGFLRIVTGGGVVGAALTKNPRVAHVHITGAAATFDAIVWGPSTGSGTGASARRRRENRPLLKKPITAELGGVSPIIVVPGAWTKADLRFQAEHIATMRLQNSGHNCIAGQVVIMSADWPQREAFLGELRAAYDRAPERPVWYPRSDEKLDAAASAHPSARWNASRTRVIVEADAASATDLERTEYFAPVLGVVSLRGNGQEFLDAAVEHANERLAGTLGANVLIDPATMEALGEGFERAMAGLRYGTVAINAWTAFGFLTPTLTWGAFPGSTPADVQSGLGVVHNALLLDRVERSVVRGPFRPFPRSVPLMARSLSLSKGTVLPKPPWFVTARTGATVSEGFTRFRMDGDWVRIAGTLVQAFRA
ncbi:aldehyde dehydrogenase family protein [Microbacterium sp.]|uniref:aldehyde dehydrogenase family protein n=1 Tax=Microbacterium sp. TaxID=51671 RepID=UPI0039C9A8C3